jgi:calmodulin-binding transcription activator
LRRLRCAGGSLFLIDRGAVRFFRRDGYSWRKKADGKTVRETHEKLKVGNVDMLNCYYAHGDESEDMLLKVGARLSVRTTHACSI